MGLVSQSLIESIDFLKGHSRYLSGKDKYIFILSVIIFNLQVNQIPKELNNLSIHSLWVVEF